LFRARIDPGGETEHRLPRLRARGLKVHHVRPSDLPPLAGALDDPRPRVGDAGDEEVESRQGVVRIPPSAPLRYKTTSDSRGTLDAWAVMNNDHSAFRLDGHSYPLNWACSRIAGGRAASPIRDGAW